ncbi:hypothetical protein C8D88_105372 [Lentzea atacamensis]|uniref:Uncharacterized protein n=1 Tax=Lentzea atacamensis TaxID=531938 RepID=A0A316HYU3_9PSEU|nr:hypothetical protein C8D88_105372 [Lentzea atacamensis]
MRASEVRDGQVAVSKVTSSMAGKELTVTVVAVEAGRADGTAEGKAVTVRG